MCVAVATPRGQNRMSKTTQHFPTGLSSLKKSEETRVTCTKRGLTQPEKNGGRGERKREAKKISRPRQPISTKSSKGNHRWLVKSDCIVSKKGLREARRKKQGNTKKLPVKKKVECGRMNRKVNKPSEKFNHKHFTRLREEKNRVRG